VVDIIVFHTAWMNKYNGDRESLRAGGFKFAAEHGYGHEMYNFRIIDGYCYGYVPPTGNLHFEEHFDVPTKTKKLEGVTIVWTAPHPEQGGRAVVGVWRDAIVYREDQNPSREVARRRKISGEIAGYRARALSKNCMLFPPDTRPMFVLARQSRRGESWPGQQKVFYPKPGSQALRLLSKIVRDIDLRVSPAAKAKTRKEKNKPSGWQADIEKRQRVEKTAIEAVGHYLEDAGYLIKSVEKDNLGYDLVAKRGQEILHVEVKGRSGVDVAAELSVNEFEYLSRYQNIRNSKAHYRIAIVTNALSEPVIHEFVLVRGQTLKEHEWWTLDGRWSLKFEERTAARLTATRPA
jgi:hypothetical protein